VSKSRQHVAFCTKYVFRRAERELGAKFLVGFETEFILLDRQDKPASTGAWSTSRKLQCGPVTDCVHDIAQTIIDAGIKLELYHAESADGQVCSSYY
jgi:glutamine synthetase